MTSADTLTAIKAAILGYLPDAAVWLFGSRVKKQEDAHSDYDLLVVTGKDMDQHGKMDFEKKIRKGLTIQFEQPFDIIVETREDWQKKRNLVGHIVYYASKEGVQI